MQFDKSGILVISVTARGSMRKRALSLKKEELILYPRVRDNYLEIL